MGDKVSLNSHVTFPVKGEHLIENSAVGCILYTTSTFCEMT